MFESGKLKKIFNGGTKQSTYIISEIGINHNGSFDTAVKLMEASKKAGVDAVKFQKRDLDEIYSKSIIKDSNSAEWSFDYLIPLLKEFELSHEAYYEIRKKCDELELDLIVTPMDHKSAQFVADLGVSAFKISSADMTNIPLIELCAQYQKPLIVSTGMWKEEDILKCTDLYKKNNVNFALLLAQSTYPAPYESLNLNFIKKLKEISKVVGYSGHERGTFIPVAAVTLGCQIIEKHITFDKSLKGPDHKASMLPEEWSEMVYQIRMLEQALGSEKRVNQAEIQNKEAFAKSAVAKSNLKAGHILKKQDIVFKAPGKGIFPHEIDNYYGKVLKKDVEEDHYINHTDFEELTKISEWKKFSFQKDWGIKCRFHDYDKYRILGSPSVEFHCSETDLDVEFSTDTTSSRLILHAPEIFNRELVDICSEDPAKVERSLEVLQRSIDKAMQIAKYFPEKKPKLVVHLGGMFLDKLECHDTSGLTMRAVEPFKRLQYDPERLEILPENLPPRPWYMGGEWYQHGFMKAEDMVEFCKELNLKMTFDICHAQLYCKLHDQKLSEYAKIVMPYVSHLHISDAKGINGEGLQIHEGELDFDATFTEMSGFEFTWVSEIWSGHHHEGAGTYKCMQFLEKWSGLL